MAVLSQDWNGEVALDGTPGALDESCRQNGIDRALVMPVATRPDQVAGINRWAYSLMQKKTFPHLQFFGAIHPQYEGWAAELQRLHAWGFKGIKLHPDYQDFYVDEERMFPLYSLALELGLIILFHAGRDPAFEEIHCPPHRLAALRRRLPGGVMVAGHMGGENAAEVEEYLLGLDLYLETSMTLTDLPAERVRRWIAVHGAEKILFGSDSPWTYQAKSLEAVYKLGLTPAQTAAVIGGNARKLLKREI